MNKRYGIYFAPSTSSELWQLGGQWLGRDCAKNIDVAHPQLGDIQANQLHDATKSPRRYGLHATLKPPFQLNAGCEVDMLKSELFQFAQKIQPVEIEQLKLKAIGQFLALVPSPQSSALEQLAADCVIQFDKFRAPLSAERRAQRMQAGLNERQIELLDQWGYPYVLDQFKMHITLTDRLDETTGPKILKAAKTWFAPVIGQPLLLDRICLFEEPAKNAPFKRIADFKLLGKPQMKAS